MKILIKQLSMITFFGVQSGFAMQQPSSMYNNARLIFHAIGPKSSSLGLAGIDPSVSLSAMEASLQTFTAQIPDLPTSIKERMEKAKKSLETAKARYLTCISWVKLTQEPAKLDEMAEGLAEQVRQLAQNESQPSLLFIGGQYLYKNGSLGGHTASYKVKRQADGQLCFKVFNTVKTEKHKVDGNRIHQLVYSDLGTADLDKDFWKNVIKTNYMNPIQGKFLMESFYDYLDKKLLKDSNKTHGESFKGQEDGGVCAWKAISVWLHDEIAPGERRVKRDAAQELAYVRYKGCMFGQMSTNFKPDNSMAQETATTLRVELGKKVQKMNEISALLRKP